MDVANIWTRLAIDVTHYRQLPYLSMVDCGPGRFAIWKRLIVVVRHHRTIKRLSERANISPTESVYWYNLTLRSGLDEDSIPQRAFFRYVWRTPLDGARDEEQITSDLRLGEEVWVKPPYARCTPIWNREAITNIKIPNNVLVNGMPRHRLFGKWLNP